MGIDKLKRVLWRLRTKYPNQKRYTWKELKRCIMIECGTSPQTYYNNKKALRDLGWIQTYRKRRFTLTEADLDDNY